jgi:hypothetical protein
VGGSTGIEVQLFEHLGTDHALRNGELPPSPAAVGQDVVEFEAHGGVHTTSIESPPARHQ